MLEKTKEMNLLLDFYENLLTLKQKEILTLYYREDLSLREIAENLSTTHASVYDSLKRSEKKLMHFEKSLQLVKRHQKRYKIYDRIKVENNDTINKLINELENIDKEEL